MGLGWDVAAVRDVNGDSFDDLIWRDTSGNVTQWLGTGTSFNGAGQPFYPVGNDWAIVG